MTHATKKLFTCDRCGNKGDCAMADGLPIGWSSSYLPVFNLIEEAKGIGDMEEFDLCVVCTGEERELEAEHKAKLHSWLWDRKRGQ